MGISFDITAAPDLYIDLDPSRLTYTAQDIYSRWKDWVLGGNAQWPPAFRTVGGDVTGEGEFAPRFFFIRNDLGWKIRKPDASGEFLINGNLIGEDTSVATLSEPVGPFTPTVRLAMTQVSGVNTQVFWQAVISDFDQGTAGYIIQRLLKLAEADESLTATKARLWDRETGEKLLEKNVVGGSIMDVQIRSDL